MNLNLEALLATCGVAPLLAREALDPVGPWIFLEPSDPSLPITHALPGDLAELHEQDPGLRVIGFRELRKSEATRFTLNLTLERQAAREVEAAPEPQDEAWGSWMIRHRLMDEDDEEGRRAISEIRPAKEAAAILITEGEYEDEDWQLHFVNHVPRKIARIIARYFELLAEDKEATRREAARQAAEQAAATSEEPTP